MGRIAALFKADGAETARVRPDLRSWRPSPARHLDRDAPAVIIRPVGPVPSRRAPRLERLDSRPGGAGHPTRRAPGT